MQEASGWDRGENANSHRRRACDKNNKKKLNGKMEKLMRRITKIAEVINKQNAHTLMTDKGQKHQTRDCGWDVNVAVDLVEWYLGVVSSTSKSLSICP